MKAATFVFLLAVCGTVMGAQSSTDPSADVTIGIMAGSAQYCLEGRSPDDITLRLELKVWYENHRSDTIILPTSHHRLTRMTVTGQNGSTIVRDARLGIDVKAVMAMPRPDISNSPFLILAGAKGESSPALDWLKCLPAATSAGQGCFLDTAVIPVLHRSSGLDLRGKTIQIVTTRDHRALTPDAVEKLNEKWKDYGTVWVGVVESEPITLWIPEEPLTRNCATPSIPLPH